MAVKKKAATKTAATKGTATTSVAPATEKKAPVKKAVAAPKKAATSKVVTKKSATSAATKTRTALEGVSTFTPYEPAKGEEYMGRAMRDHFSTILVSWRRELMEEVDRTVTHMKDEAANFPDPNDRATQESEFTMELRARDRERKLIKKIDEAIDLVDNNDYGYCESCGVEIGIRRLEARPTATLCIECKTLDEIREKQRG